MSNLYDPSKKPLGYRINESDFGAVQRRGVSPCIGIQMRLSYLCIPQVLTNNLILN